MNYLTHIQENIPIRNLTDGTERPRTVLVPILGTGRGRARLFSNFDEDRARGAEILTLRDKDEKKWSSLGDLIPINLPVKPGNFKRS